jgi:hypothetical protein
MTRKRMSEGWLTAQPERLKRFIVSSLRMTVKRRP